MRCVMARRAPKNIDPGVVTAVNCLANVAEVKPILEVNAKIRGEKVKYRKVYAILDSGAAENVMPGGILEDYPEVKGEAFKNQVVYTTADGGEIPNLGEKSINFFTREQIPCKIDFQLADVRRPLLAVSALTAKGHTVELSESGGKIKLASGKEIGVQRRNGVFMLEMWVPPFPGQGA